MPFTRRHHHRTDSAKDLDQWSYSYITHAQSFAKYILDFWYSFLKFRSFNTVNEGSVDLRDSKLLAVKVGGLEKKVCCPAPAPLKPVGLDLSSPWVESFSKFHGQ